MATFPRGSMRSLSRESDQELDEEDRGDKPAKAVLRKNRLKQDQRKQKETKEKLDNIQDRISLALSKYDLGISNILGGVSESDFKLDRAKSEQAFDVYIVGFNESAEKKNKLLESLYTFFLVYEEDGDQSPEFQVDLEASYSIAQSCLATATDSLTKLSDIHSNLVNGFQTKLKDKENKKKTKKLEQSFKEAQNELLSLRDTLETTTRSLNEANTKVEGLRKTLDYKNTELEKNKTLIDKLRKQAEHSLSEDERRVMEERASLVDTLSKENSDLKVHLAQAEFAVRQGLSKAVNENEDATDTEEMMANLQRKMLEEREKHEEALRVTRAGMEAEVEEALERQGEGYQVQMDDLRNRISLQQNTIEDLEARLADAERPVSKPPTPPEPEPEPESEEESEEEPTERTTSQVSVDPTEALNKKFRELEEDYEKKRKAVEEEMAKNDEQNKWRVEELRNELLGAKEEWETEKTELENKVEQFRKMVAEMEAESQERTHRLKERLETGEETDSGDAVATPDDTDPGLDSSELIAEVIQPEVTIRPTTAVRNTLTPGPENPIITKVVSMYDHVTDFKEKLIGILAEIQRMGVIDETETMLMRRSMEQLETLDFNKEGDVHEQIEGIQNSIAQVMHGSEKTVHKIFKKLSKERSKIEQLSSWVGEPTSRPVSTKSSKTKCDRATSPVSHFGGKPLQTREPPTINRRPAAQYTAMFAHHDLEHNRRNLRQALHEHKITPSQYEEAIAMMRNYVTIPQRRLQHLARQYISHARMQIMEENIHMNRPVENDIDDVLNRLDELYLLRKARYGTDMDQLAAEREDLAYLLTKQLDRLEHQSGIFLIKPYIAYKSHTAMQVTKKPVLPVQTTRSTEQQRTDQPPPPQQQDSPHTWAVNTSRTNPIYDDDTWTPDIPRLLEMDCNRLTLTRNTVSQPSETSHRTLKSFVVVRQSTSTRGRATAATSAEFLSVASDKSEVSDQLPPLRSGSSGFVSTSSSRQKLAPLTGATATIKVEKATTVT